MPKIALAPIVILWFGTGLVSKVALAVSLKALIAAYGAARGADPDLQALLASKGGTKHRIFRGVIVPSTLPAIIGLFRIDIGFALVSAVVGEFISSQRGLGHMIHTASSLYDLDTFWVDLFVLTAVGFVLHQPHRPRRAPHPPLAPRVGRRPSPGLTAIPAAPRPRPGRRAGRAAHLKATVSQAFRSILYLPLYVALGDGLFAAAGIDVTKETAGAAKWRCRPCSGRARSSRSTARNGRRSRPRRARRSTSHPASTTAPPSGSPPRPTSPSRTCTTSRARPSSPA